MRTVLFMLSNGRSHKLEMEVDSASPVIIIPRWFYDDFLQEFPLFPSRYQFEDYNSGNIMVEGFITIDLQVGRQYAEQVAVYVSKENSRALMGRNGMVLLNLVPELKKMSAKVSSISITELKKKYPNLFKSDIGRVPKACHKIILKPDAVPYVLNNPRAFPFKYADKLKEALEKMVQNDLIEQIDCSDWVHPLHVVGKKGNAIRICNDLTKLNPHTVVEKFVMPTAEELIVKLAGAKVFTKLDIKSAYFHMPLHPESRHLTAFLTSHGLYQYKVLPMGLSSSGACWQRFMSQRVADLPGVCVYMDDILVFGKDSQDHAAKLQMVLERLNSLNIRLNESKCVWNAQSLEFLGHTISNAGLQPSADNTKAILKAPEPMDKPSLLSFLGMCTFYLRFLPNFATTAEPLRKLTRKQEVFQWETAQKEAFAEIKKMIATAPILAVFDPKCKIVVSADASDYGMGAVLSQIQNGKECPVAFTSRTLSPRERTYSVGEKEALACVYACEKWDLYLYGREFMLRTDHSSLTTLLKRGNKGQRPLRINRWYTRLLRYNFDIVYRPGVQNQVADALSRLPLPAETDSVKSKDEMYEEEVIAFVSSLHTETALSRDEIKTATNADQTLHEVMQYLHQGWPKEKKMEKKFLPFLSVKSELSVIEGCLMRGDTFVIPESLVKKVIHLAHESHPGIVRTKERIRQLYWWPRLNASVETMIQECIACQIKLLRRFQHQSNQWNIQ